MKNKQMIQNQQIIQILNSKISIMNKVLFKYTDDVESTSSEPADFKFRTININGHDIKQRLYTRDH